MSKFRYINRKLVLHKPNHKIYNSVLNQFSKLTETNTRSKDITTF